MSKIKVNVTVIARYSHLEHCTVEVDTQEVYDYIEFEAGDDPIDNEDIEAFVYDTFWDLKEKGRVNFVRTEEDEYPEKEVDEVEVLNEQDS